MCPPLVFGNCSICNLSQWSKALTHDSVSLSYIYKGRGIFLVYDSYESLVLVVLHKDHNDMVLFSCVEACGLPYSSTSLKLFYNPFPYGFYVI